MIDYEFYRRIGDAGIKTLFREKDASKLFEKVEANMSDLPYVDQVETTNRCNMACVMCPRGAVNHMTRSLGTMGAPLFKRIVDQIEEVEQEKRRRGIGKADFLASPPTDLIWQGSVNDICDLRLHHFGSPTLDTGLADKVAYVKTQTGFGVHFSESASNLTPRKVQSFFDAGLDRLTIALDGTNAEEYYQTRGRWVDFDKVVKNIQGIIQLKVDGKYPTKLFIQLIQLEGAPKEKFVEEWETQPGVEILHKPFFPYPDVPHNLVTETDKVFYRRCKIPFTSITVLADGRVVPCNSDYNGEQVLGDLNTDTLQDVWTGGVFRGFREQFIYDTFRGSDLCNRCGYYPFYKGQKGIPLPVLPQ